MKNGWLRMWLRFVLAVSAIGAGPVWAESAHGCSEQALVIQSPGVGEMRLEVASAHDIEPGSWVLVEVVEGRASRSRELMQVWAAGVQGLELGRPLVGIPRVADDQVRLLCVEQQSQGDASPRLDRPQQGAEVPDGELLVEGQAQQGSRVLVFIDGVESASWDVDDSGRFEGVIKMTSSPGKHQVQVVSGFEGVWSLDPEPVTVVVSLAPPPNPVVLEPTAGAFTNDTTPLFRGTAQMGATVFVAISGTDVGSASVDNSGNWSLSLSTPLDEGSYTASIRAQAPNGETSGSVFVSFRVDVTPPNVNIIEGPPDYTTSRSVSVRFMSSESGVVECILDGVSIAKPCFPPFEASDLMEGRHVLVLIATDRAGNVDLDPTTVQWVVDFTLPTVVFRSGPPTWSRADRASFMLEASEEIALYECALDGPTWKICNDAPVVLGLSEGAHTLAVRVTDKAGQVSPTIRHEWNVDFTAPPTPVLLQPVAEALLNSQTPDISGRGEPGTTVKVLLKGSERCTATVDALGNWTCKPTSPLTTDSYELALEVQDRAGNVNNQFTPIFFRVDVDLPNTFIDLPDTFITDGPEIITQNARPRFGLRSNEGGVTFECSLGEEAFGPCDEFTNGSHSFEPGRYTLRGRARDAAGNVDDSPATVTWVYSLYESSGGGLSGCSASGAAPFLPLVPLLAFLKRRRSRSSQREVVGGSGLLALLMVLQAGSAHAQGVDLQQYKPAPGLRDVLGVFSPQVAPGFGLHAGLSVSYARNPLVLRNASDGGFAQSIVSDQLTADVLASISFLNHFELGLALPVTGQWGPTPGDLGVFIPENVTGTGLGDLRLVPKAVLPLGETLSLGAAAVVSLPTANSQSFLGAGGVGVQPMLLAQWAASPQLRVLANMGGRFQPAKQVPLLGLNVGNELTYALGAHWSRANSKLFVQGSLEGAVALNNAQSNTLPLELLAAVGYSLPSGMSVQLGGGPGLTSGYGTPNFRFFARLDWGSSDPIPPRCTGNPDLDDDKDGVLNVGDLCPYEQGHRGDGCPKDNGAGRVNALAQLFKNDSDNDGLLDDADACPNERGVPERRGCAVPAQAAAKDSESITVTLSFPSGKPETDSPKKLDTVVARVQELLKNNQLAEVHASFPPDQAGATLMQQRAESVRGYLSQRIPELKGPGKLKVDSQGKPAKRSGNKELLDIKFILMRPVASKQLPPPPELKCADQGVAARLMSSHGEVTAGAENTLKALANEGTVCDGDLVKTGPAAGAVLVLSEGNVLRLAPDSQVKLSRKGIQLLQGTAEPQGSQASLASPEILRPCEGSISRPAAISWHAVPGARRYWVQVSRGTDFDSDVHFVLSERTGVTLELPAGGKWYWRVLPVDGKGLAGQPSKIHAFEVSEAVAVNSKG